MARSPIGLWSTLILAQALLVSGCAHSQQPERRVYVIEDDAAGVGGSGTRNCETEHIECFDKCWNSPLPLKTIKRGSGKHHEFCSEQCLKAYQDCVQELGQSAQAHSSEALRFPSMENALAWVREHKTEVAIGTIVVVAGVVFIVSTGGSGALVLAPLAL
ncbi:hypothetical protein ACN469_02645 [Corallococcus terminator]